VLRLTAEKQAELDAVSAATALCRIAKCGDGA